jgi:hypothetical protein
LLGLDVDPFFVEAVASPPPVAATLTEVLSVSSSGDADPGERHPGTERRRERSNAHRMARTHAMGSGLVWGLVMRRRVGEGRVRCKGKRRGVEDSGQSDGRDFR